MIINLKFFPLYFLLLISGELLAQDTIINLCGSWQFCKAGSSEWMDARVPGVVHLDLMSNQKIPDPFLYGNEKDLQWIGKTEWEYRREFQYNKDEVAGKHPELVFSGLDTYAMVFLNDSLIIRADNMFREWGADVQSILREGLNTVRVVFQPAEEENKRRYSALGYRLPGDEKVVCRKAAYHFGWDWGPTLITCGIWQPVFIRNGGSSLVTSSQVIQTALNDSVATLAVRLQVKSDNDDSLLVRTSIDSSPVTERIVPIRKGSSEVRVPLTIRNPERWWPSGTGSQRMYKLGIELKNGAGLIWKSQRRIGLRTVELVREPDSNGRSFYFRINGFPVYMKGANYIPLDNFLPRVTDSAYQALILDVKDMNISMLRVWGGGVYEKDLFYELCDENGILVWQDFMFACAMYPGDSVFLENARGEIKEQIIRLGHHPSIILWCGNNEIDEGWKNWGWQKAYGYSAADSARVWEAYLTVFEKMIPSLLFRYDTLRPYVPTSPQFGWGRAESMREGDSHYWGVWWGKEPFSLYRKKVGRFMSEFGFQGFPDFTTIKRFTHPGDRVCGSEVMKVHQKHPTGYEIIDEYMRRDYRKPRDFESYAYVSQLLQADGMRIAIQAQRKSMPRCMGTLYWQLNDCWPVVSWSARDYYGKKKALYYETRRQYAKILATPILEDETVEVFGISDALQDEKVELRLRLVDFNGNELFYKSMHADIPPGRSRLMYSIPLRDLTGSADPSSVVFSAAILQNGRENSTNLLYFVSPGELDLSIPDIKVKVLPGDDEVEVILESDKLAKNVFLSTGVDGEFSDNYFDLLPGEIRAVRFIPSGKDVPGVKNIKIRSLVDTY